VNTQMKKRFIQEQELLEQSYRLAVQVFESGFRPDFIVGLWRGGSTVGIYVQECLQYLGVTTDHISVRTSYRGREDYLQKLEYHEPLRAHGLHYLIGNLNADDSLLIVDDVYSTGRHVNAVIVRLQTNLRKNLPNDIRIAAPYYRPGVENAEPDYFLVKTQDWLVLPYELTGLSRTELEQGKTWVLPLLDELKPGWR